MGMDEKSFDGTLSDIVQPGELVADKYRIERVMGIGGMGVVVQAFHLHFEERVAIKLLHPHLIESDEARARFEREARAAFKIKSEHVARVIDVGALAKARVPYMVMEYLEGTDMADILAERTRLPIEDSIDFIMQTAEAVGEAHTLGIVHRDLKPENLFLTLRSDGTTCIKVLDFGLSKLHTPASPRKRERTLTSTRQPMGTPQYMSPEQWMSAKDVGPSTDIWALGVMLYEFVTGAQPFNRDQLPQLCTMVLQGEPVPMSAIVSDTPETLESVVGRCLRKRPEDRYANIAQLAAELHRIAPRRVRVSAKRIAGVFRRAGIDPGDVPPPSTDAPEVFPEPTPYPPPRLDGEPRPSRGKTYDSDTHVMPDRADRSDDGGDPKQQELLPELSSTLVMGESASAETTPLPFKPTGASASGRYPAVPMGKAGESGRFPAVLPDQSGASGEYRAALTSAPGEGPTFDGLAASDRHRRAVTAQSWQHVLGEPVGRSSNKRIAVIVATAGILCVIVAAVAILGSGSDSIAPSVGTSTLPTALPAAEGDHEIGGDTEPASTPSSAPNASAAPAGSDATKARTAPKATPRSAPAPGPRPRTAPRPRQPVVKSAPPPSPQPSSIFDER